MLLARHARALCRPQAAALATRHMSTILPRRRGMLRSVKVSVVGAGQVGVACVVSSLEQGVCDELALVDVNRDRVLGEVQDLQHGEEFLHNAQVYGGTDFASTANSDVVVLTAGVRQQVGESRLQLVHRNVEVFKQIVPRVVENSPDAVIIVVSNPCDIMSYVAWKLSGLPAARVFGSGTSLDTARFRHFLADNLDVGASSVHGWVIGEHGDSSVPVWSSVNVAGVPMGLLPDALNLPQKDINWAESHKKVVQAAGDVIKLKGYTNWGIGMTVADLIASIVHNRRDVHALSTLVNGMHGVDVEAFASVPCLLGSSGIQRAIPMQLNDDESARFANSVGVIWKTIQDVKL